jgi:hypothetical protein
MVVMATIDNWNKYINLLHEHALVEYDLRETVDRGGAQDYYQDVTLATRVLYERFGVY